MCRTHRLFPPREREREREREPALPSLLPRRVRARMCCAACVCECENLRAIAAAFRCIAPSAATPRYSTAGGVRGGLSLWPAATVLVFAVEPPPQPRGRARARGHAPAQEGARTPSSQPRSRTFLCLCSLAPLFVANIPPSSPAQIGNIVWWILAHVVLLASRSF